MTEEVETGVSAVMAAQMREGLARVAGPDVEEDVAAAREAGEALRRVIDRLTGTSAPPEVLREAVERLAPIDDLLRPYHAVRSYRGASETSLLGHDRAFFDWSPLFGLANPLAPPIRVAVEGEEVVGSVRFGIAYEGPPGCVHGGYIAATFDELLGMTQALTGKRGMTGTLTIRYRRPTPLHRDLRWEGEVVREEGRKIFTTGRCLDGEQMTAEAEGTFVVVDFSRIEALYAQRAAWEAGRS